jgi:hypothetical protein
MKISYCGVRWTKLYLQYYGTDHVIASKLEEMQAKESDGVKMSDELAFGTALEYPALHFGNTMKLRS